MTMDKNVLKKASKRFEEVFGELPADYGYPAIRMWDEGVLFARSAEDADSFISAHKTLKYTGIRILPLILILSLFVFIIVGASFKWEFAVLLFCFINIIAYKVVRKVRKKAHRTINGVEQMILYSPDDDCFYQV